MSPDVVLRKTAKGREEIEKRTVGLDHKRRSILIMVDGRSDAAGLAGKLAHLPNSMALLDSLLAEGFVEPATGSPGAAAPAAPPPSGAGKRDLDDLKRTASKAIERLMGPDGDALALKIEGTATPEEFFAEAAKAREALRAFLGPRRAEEFWKSLG